MNPSAFLPTPRDFEWSVFRVLNGAASAATEVSHKKFFSASEIERLFPNNVQRLYIKQEDLHSLFLQLYSVCAS